MSTTRTRINEWWGRYYKKNPIKAFGIPFVSCFLGTIYFTAKTSELYEIQNKNKNNYKMLSLEDLDKHRAAKRIDIAQYIASKKNTGVWNDYEMVPVPPKNDDYPMLRGSELDNYLIERTKAESVVTKEEESRRRRLKRKREVNI